MTINRSLYIVTEQVEQQAEHDKVSVYFVGFNPRDANHAFIDRPDKDHRYLFHRVNMNNMGACYAQEITYNDLVQDAQSFREMDAQQDTKETGI